MINYQNLIDAQDQLESLLNKVKGDRNLEYNLTLTLVEIKRQIRCQESNKL